MAMSRPGGAQRKWVIWIDSYKLFIKQIHITTERGCGWLKVWGYICQRYNSVIIGGIVGGLHSNCRYWTVQITLLMVCSQTFITLIDTYINHEYSNYSVCLSFSQMEKSNSCIESYLCLNLQYVQLKLLNTYTSHQLMCDVMSMCRSLVRLYDTILVVNHLISESHCIVMYPNVPKL